MVVFLTNTTVVRSEEVITKVLGSSALSPDDDLAIMFIHRTPKIDYVWGSTNATVDGWPTVGQNIVWEGHIKNFFAESKTFQCKWYVNNQLEKTETVSVLGHSKGIVTLSKPWSFDRSEIKLVIDSGNQIAEFEEGNNELSIFSNGIAIGFYVEQSVYDYFHTHQYKLQGVKSNCWEDWAQRQIRFFNAMCVQGVHAGVAPQGVLDRFRIDYIHVVPDGTILSGNVPNENDRSIDMMWGFVHKLVPPYDNNFYTNHTWIHNTGNNFYRETALIHELGHARYLADGYAFNTEKWQIEIKENGTLVAGTSFMPLINPNDPDPRAPVYIETTGGLMGMDYTKIGPFEAGALNRIAGRRAVKGHYNFPQNGQEYLQDIPAQNRLTVKNLKGQVLPGVSVKVYQSQNVINNGHWYPKLFDNIPDIELTSDANGQVMLGSFPFDNTSNGKIVQWADKCNSVIVLRIADGQGNISYKFMDVSFFNIEYWKGNRALADYVMTVDFPCQPLDVSSLSATSVTSATAVLGTSMIGADAYQFRYREKPGSLQGGEQPLTPQNVSFTQGKLGLAADFNVNGKVNYLALQNLDASKGSIEFWIKPKWAGNDGQTHTVVQYGAHNGLLVFKDGAGNFRALFRRWNQEQGVSYNVNDWQANIWQHVAVTWDAQSIKLYINGALRNSSTPTQVLPQLNDTYFQVGMDHQGGFLNACLDEFRISAEPRSASEVSTTFNAGTGVRLDQDTKTLLLLHFDGDLVGHTNDWIQLSQTVNKESSISNLKSGTLYEYQARIGCNNIWTLWSESKTFQTLNQSTCQAPNVQQLSAESITTVGATLKVTSLNVNAYQFKYKPLNTTTDWILMQVTNQNLMVVSGLQPNTEYEFQVMVRCNDNIWSGFSVSKIFKTLIAGGGCTIGTIIQEDFENGMGQIVDGGSDCRRVTNSSFANSGVDCVELRSKSSSSHIRTKDLNLSMYADINIGFSFISRGFNSNTDDDFFVQLSQDGGKTYQNVKNYKINQDFINDVWGNASIKVNGPFGAKCRVRIVCDAKDKNDMLYIDDFSLSGCKSNGFFENVHLENRSIEEFDVVTSLEVKLAPNPAENQFKVLITDNQNISCYQVDILNSTGTIFRSLLINGKTTEIECDAWPNGMYFVRVQYGNYQKMEKLVINR